MWSFRLGVRGSLSEEVTLRRDLKEMTEGGVLTSGGRVFQAEGIGNAWCVQRTAHAMGDASECNGVPGHGGPRRPFYRLVFHSE